MPDTMLCGGLCIEEIEQEQALKSGAGRHFRARNHLGEKTHMKCMIGLVTMVAASLVWGAASAQTASSFETDNRAKALGELTDEQSRAEDGETQRKTGKIMAIHGADVFVDIPGSRSQGRHRSHALLFAA